MGNKKESFIFVLAPIKGVFWHFKVERPRSLSYTVKTTDGSNKIIIEEKNYTSDDLFSDRLGYEYWVSKSYETLHKFSTSKDLMPGFQLQWNFDIIVPYDKRYRGDHAPMFYVR